MFAESSKTSSLTPAEAQAIAKEAYVFGLPLVYFALNGQVMTHVAKPEGPLAPYNQFAHFREFPDESNRTVVAWNVDTLYSVGTLDLTDEPLVLSIPPMGDRWWLMQIIDAWDDVPAAPGTRTEGNNGGDFALVGPNFKGTLPKDLKEVRVDTSLCCAAGRTYTAGPDDLDAVHKIQDSYKLTPLSRWGADYHAPRSVPVPEDVDAKTAVPAQLTAMPAEEFFARLCQLLVDNPARAVDQPMLDRIALIGVNPGAKFTLGIFGPDVAKAIEAGAREGREAVLAEESSMGEVVNGWSMSLDGGKYGIRYLYRAAWTWFAIGTNLAEDAVYPNTTVDADGQKLNGGHRYELNFKKNEIPPAKNFWSLTLYDEIGYLVKSPNGRHSVGDRSNMTLGADGSLAVYIQPDSPGAGKEANWLPSPAGQNFKLYLRLYTPKPEVLQGKWSPPAVKRVG